jgi:hypothetical protein
VAIEKRITGEKREGRKGETGKARLETQKHAWLGRRLG